MRPCGQILHRIETEMTVRDRGASSSPHQIFHFPLASLSLYIPTPHCACNCFLCQPLIMGQGESSQHVPNPVLDWLPRIEATHVQSSPIRRSTNWKLNTIASLPIPPYTLFVASQASIYYYDTSESLNNLQPAGTLPGETPEDDSINQVRMLKIAGILRLVAVLDSGLILLWDPMEPSKKPLRLQYVIIPRYCCLLLFIRKTWSKQDRIVLLCKAVSSAFEKEIRSNQIFHGTDKRSNDIISTWSLSGDPTAPFLYVGSNGHHVAKFDLSSNHVQNSREIVVKHDHNVPCVDVSPCGKYLATASIDSTLCITHAASKTVLGKVKLAQWGWSCLWIPKAQIICHTPADRIGWLSTIFSKDIRTPSFENVDASHYDLLQDDPALEEAPPAKKRVLNMEGLQIENLEHMEILEEEDGEVGDGEDDGEMEIQVEENGFGIIDEEDGEAEIDGAEVAHHHIPLAVDEDEGDDASEETNPFLQWASSEKNVKKTKMVEEEISSPAEYLLFGATFDELFLFDHHLKIQARTTNPLPRTEEESMVLNMLERFFFLFWIPEWSIMLSANQGIPAVYISTIRFNTLDCQYQIQPESTLPRPSERNTSSRFVLSGVSCYRVEPDPLSSLQNSFFYRLHFRLGDLLTYDLRLRDGILEASPSPQSSSSSQS